MTNTQNDERHAQAIAQAEIAWQADSDGHSDQAQQHYLAAAKGFSAIRAWSDLATVLGNLGLLGKEGQDGNPAYLAQAFWLDLFIGVPLANALSTTRALLDKIGLDHEAAPLIAATALLLVNERGKEHPEQEALQANAVALIASCAEAQGVTEDKLAAWFGEARLNDPAYFVPEAQKALIAIIGTTQWLFDPQELTPG